MRLSDIYRKLRSKLNRKNGVDYARSIGVKVGDECRLIDVTFSSEPYLVTIGNHVSATKTHFETHDGGVWIFRKKHPDWDMIAPITVGDNVYFGCGVIVLPGVTIGSNIIIGAGSIVTKDLESGFVYAGVPAKKIKSIEQYYEKVSKKTINSKMMPPKQKAEFLITKFKVGNKIVF